MVFVGHKSSHDIKGSKINPSFGKFARFLPGMVANAFVNLSILQLNKRGFTNEKDLWTFCKYFKRTKLNMCPTHSDIAFHDVEVVIAGCEYG